MWFKSGSFTGLNTDAWIFNYGVGIGSTQIPNGVRLTAGGMQVTDTTVSTPQLSVSGISTFQGQHVSTGANSTTTGGGQIYLNGATGNRIDFNTNGAAAPATTTRSVGTKIVLYPGVSASNVDYGFGIDTATLWYSVDTSGASHKWYAGTTNIATLSGTGNLTIGGGVSGATATPTNINLGLNYSNGTTRDKLKIYLYNSGTEQYGFSVGSNADVQYHSNVLHDFYVANTAAVRINGSRNLLIGSQTDTGTASQPLQVTGGAYVSGNFGIGRTNPSSKLEVLGTIAAYSADTTSVGSFSISNAGLLDITAYKSTGGALRFVTANSSGTNLDRGRVDSSGNFIIGSTSATGTSSQPLQVTGGAYVSGNLGVGVTSPSFKADIAGDARVTSTNKMRFGGTAGTTNFYIQYNSTANSLDFVAG
jgi:hypothetical protein